MSKRQYLQAFCVLWGTLGTMSGAPITFNFTSNTGVGSVGNTVTRTDFGSGVTVTVTAWSTDGTGGTFASAAVGQWGSNGMGVCSQTELSSPASSPNCSTSSEHFVDNTGTADFLLFTFSTAVVPLSVGLNNFSDYDLTYFYGGTAGPSGLTPGQLSGAGYSGPVDYSTNPADPSNGFYTASLSVSGGVTRLLLGASLSDRTPDDSFKLKSITFEVPDNDTSVPEPGTLALLGLGLAGISFIRRRR